MKIRKNFNIPVLLLLTFGLFCYGCSDWTDAEAEHYAETVDDSDFPDPGSSDDPDGPNPDNGNGGLPEQADSAFYQRLREYRASDHKKVGGWFGAWSGYSGKRLSQGSLAALPYGIDFACLWLFNLEAAEMQNIENLHRDAAEFHRRGGVTLACWTTRNIGDGVTPKGQTPTSVFGTGEEGIKKYAQAIVDFCVKYHIDGFENDLEGMGWFADRERLNLFMRELIARFKEAHEQHPEDCAGIVSVDIPMVWSEYKLLDNDVLENLYMVQWQCYSSMASNLNSSFNAIYNGNPTMYNTVVNKSILTATFEEGEYLKNYLEKGIQNNKDKEFNGAKVAGFGAYHIEQDFNDSRYEYVRKCIKLANPQMPDEFNVTFNYE